MADYTMEDIDHVEATFDAYLEPTAHTHVKYLVYLKDGTVRDEIEGDLDGMAGANISLMMLEAKYELQQRAAASAHPWRTSGG